MRPSLVMQQCDMPTRSLVTMSRSQAATHMLVCSPPRFSCVRVPAASSPRPGLAPVVAASAWLLVTRGGELVRVGSGGGEISLTR